MKQTYPSIEDCRREIKHFKRHLQSGTDDNDESKRTQKSTNKYIRDIRWLDHWMSENDIEEITDIGRIESRNIGYVLSEEFNGSTGFYRYITIRRMFSWFKRSELVEENPFEIWNPKEDFGLSKKSEQSKHLDDDEDYFVSNEEIEIMMQNPGRHKIRNRLIIQLLWQSGMRRGELSRLELSDINRDEREIVIRKSISKNNLERTVAYQRSLDGYMGQWLDGGLRNEMMSGRDHDLLLCGERGGRLRGDAINDVIKKSAERGGINRVLDYESKNGDRWKITSHNIRHGTATYMIHEENADVWAVSKVLGHSSVEFTEKTYVGHNSRAGLDEMKKHGPG